MKMSAEEVRSVNQGVAIETFHFIGDGIWALGNEPL
jgi:predicted ribosome-associated RNA-binding protein Tma20